jgi:hypothetical protein
MGLDETHEEYVSGAAILSLSQRCMRRLAVEGKVDMENCTDTLFIACSLASQLSCSRFEYAFVKHILHTYVRQSTVRPLPQWRACLGCMGPTRCMLGESETPSVSLAKERHERSKLDPDEDFVKRRVLSVNASGNLQ